MRELVWEHMCVCVYVCEEQTSNTLVIGLSIFDSIDSLFVGNPGTFVWVKLNYK